jgi:site-specific DNA recombinase
MTKRAVVYARVSTDEQGKGYSLPTQLDACRQYAAEHHCSVVREFVDDYTGTTLDRPALNELHELVASGSVDLVICYEIDRLARKMVYQLILEEEFAKRDVTVEYVLGRYEATPEGQLMKQIRATLAEYERAKILERTLRGKKGRALAGNVYPGAQAPYGYRYVSEPHKGRLVIDPEEADVVRLIFQWYTKGDETGRLLGAGEIASKLSRMRILTRRDKQLRGPTRKLRESAVWSKSTVEKMLGNETYAGVWHWNKTVWVGKTLVDRPREQWIAVEVPPIVDRAVWETARRQAGQNKATAKRNTKYEYLMRGRLVCTRCGKRFGGYMNRLQKPARPYYQCLGQKREHAPDYENKPCRWSLRADEVDALVWEEIRQLLQHPDMLLEGVRLQQTQADTELSVLRGRIAALDNAVRELDRQRSKLLDLYLSTDELPKDSLQEKMGEIGRKRDAAAQERAELEGRAADRTPNTEDILAIEACCAELASGIDEFTFEDKERSSSC